MKNFLFVFETEKSAKNLVGEILFDSQNDDIGRFGCCLQYLRRTSCIFCSQSSQVSLGSSVRPSKRRLLSQDLSSNSIRFFGTSFGSKRSFSSTCISDFILEMSFFTMASSSSSLPFVNSKLFVILRTSLDILS